MIEVKQGYRFNDEGEYVEPVILEQDEHGIYVLPEDCTDEPLPQPNWKPIFNKEDGKWVETITAEELEELQNPPKELTEMEQLAQQNTELELQSMEQGQQLTDMELRLLALEVG